MPYPSDLNFEPVWLRLLRRLVLGHGVLRSTVFLTLAISVLGVLASQGVITVLGRGDRWLALVIPLLTTLSMTPPLAFAGLRLVFTLELARRQLEILASHDDLTGLHNRRYFLNRVEAELDRAKRYRSSAALLLIDIDRFKQVNDNHGHACGDEVLRRIAATASDLLRQPDLLARYGGEEFVVFLPHTDTLGAIDVAERLRERVQSLVLDWQGQRVTTSVSIGVAPLRHEMASLDWLLHEADTALYTAKAEGRNCVRSLPLAASPKGMVSPAPR